MRLIFFKRDLLKRHIKETYNRGDQMTVETYGKRPIKVKGPMHMQRDLQKRPTKETYKRDLQKRSNDNQDMS